MESLKKLGVLGKHLPHSLSPELHTSLFKKWNLRGEYKIYEMKEEEVLNLFPFMKKQNLLGMNVTIPYKETVFPLMDHIDEHAKKIGAVNTIFLKGSEAYGFNTDYIGAQNMFHRADIDLHEKTAVILGSGGASRALIYALNLSGVTSITVAARNKKAAAMLQHIFPYIQLTDFSILPLADLLVNTTPVGMFPKIDECPVAREDFKKYKIAADIVYNPLFTTFLKTAKKEGLQTVTGLSMLVDQAIAAESIWLQKEIDFHEGDEVLQSLSEKFQA